MITKDDVFKYFSDEDGDYAIKCVNIEEGLAFCKWLEDNGFTDCDGCSYEYDEEIIDFVVDTQEYPLLFCADGCTYGSKTKGLTVINYSELFGNNLAVELL